MQTTNTILMVRPFYFRRNEETAVNNFFQAKNERNDRLSDLAITEFDNFVKVLKNAGIKVFVVQDPGKLDTPDSIFPNNVISFHVNKSIIYPMFAENRRNERQLNYLGKLDQAGTHYETVQDYSTYEDQNKFLEGTGSMILDRVNKIAYCSLSDRANEELFHIFCKDQGYTPLVFHSTQQVGEAYLPIYHSNVMMSVGTNFSVICLEVIRNPEERELVVSTLKNTGKEIIEISEDQMNHFAGNILEVRNIDGDPVICMSSQAFESFEEEQIEALEKHGKIAHAPLFSIEKYGGGSARCMMAEVF
ncbi:citrulline utilization hydrolase CtlX [Sphingobacterium sp.]|uniref:citrulline utilization hydrolase CtlX n=1 Tax=Sphingobacterium sp. TaxID=341027 RepID=UPI0028B17B16|nr:arginine deiminase-related protein [Sphingobacterium sp.]